VILSLCPLLFARHFNLHLSAAVLVCQELKRVAGDADLGAEQEANGGSAEGTDAQEAALLALDAHPTVQPPRRRNRSTASPLHAQAVKADGGDGDGADESQEGDSDGSGSEEFERDESDEGYSESAGWCALVFVYVFLLSVARAPCLGPAQKSQLLTQNKRPQPPTLGPAQKSQLLTQNKRPQPPTH
jgi:hypothetical protein